MMGIAFGHFYVLDAFAWKMHPKQFIPLHSQIISDAFLALSPSLALSFSGAPSPLNSGQLVNCVYHSFDGVKSESKWY